MLWTHLMILWSPLGQREREKYLDQDLSHQMSSQDSTSQAPDPVKMLIKVWSISNQVRFIQCSPAISSHTPKLQLQVTCRNQGWPQGRVPCKSKPSPQFLVETTPNKTASAHVTNKWVKSLKWLRKSIWDPNQNLCKSGNWIRSALKSKGMLWLSSERTTKRPD